jgi:hypothetical protein
MPLVYAGESRNTAPTRAQERARKVNPEYSRGEPVKVAYTRNQAESDLVQNILLEEGIPSMARRTRGFDVPDFLAGGPRDVLVPESGAEAARDLLRDAEVAEVSTPSGPAQAEPGWAKIAFWVVAGGGLAALVAWALTSAAG